MTKVDHGLDPCTSTVEHFVIQHHKRKVVFVDTPGFNHPTKADGDVLKEIVDWLKNEYVLSQFLYFILILRQMSRKRTVRRYYLFV